MNKIGKKVTTVNSTIFNSNIAGKVYIRDCTINNCIIKGSGSLIGITLSNCIVDDINFYFNGYRSIVINDSKFIGSIEVSTVETLITNCELNDRANIFTRDITIDGLQLKNDEQFSNII
jgi:hypothetical protein